MSSSLPSERWLELVDRLRRCPRFGGLEPNTASAGDGGGPSFGEMAEGRSDSSVLCVCGKCSGSASSPSPPASTATNSSTLSAPPSTVPSPTRDDLRSTDAVLGLAAAAAELLRREPGKGCDELLGLFGNSGTAELRGELALRTLEAAGDALSEDRIACDRCVDKAGEAGCCGPCCCPMMSTSPLSWLAMLPRRSFAVAGPARGPRRAASPNTSITSSSLVSPPPPFPLPLRAAARRSRPARRQLAISASVSGSSTSLTSEEGESARLVLVEPPVPAGEADGDDEPRRALTAEKDDFLRNGGGTVARRGASEEEAGAGEAAAESGGCESSGETNTGRELESPNEVRVREGAMLEASEAERPCPFGIAGIAASLLGAIPFTLEAYTCGSSVARPVSCSCCAGAAGGAACENCARSLRSPPASAPPVPASTSPLALLRRPNENPRLCELSPPPDEGASSSDGRRCGARET